MGQKKIFGVDAQLVAFGAGLYAVAVGLFAHWITRDIWEALLGVVLGLVIGIPGTIIQFRLINSLFRDRD